MALKFQFAKGIASLSRVLLKHVVRRPALNFPGKIALYIDKNLLQNASANLRSSICVVGTNGKTTVTNMLADIFQKDTYVVCNRSGANLDSGVASVLLEAQSDLAHNKDSLGIFECDELWLAKILPFLQSDYVILLNLFRDQLDRVGEITRIQHSIVKALESSPRTTLIYNSDDPHCEYIARLAPNPSVAFGVEGSLKQENNSPTDAPICQQCSSFLSYSWRQYSQLGNYKCTGCDFKRTTPSFYASDISLGSREISFDVVISSAINTKKCKNTDSDNNVNQTKMRLNIDTSGVYMIYNLLAVSAAALLCNAKPQTIAQVVKDFKPNNGRLEQYKVGTHDILLNLAKNPTGFDQNIAIITSENDPNFSETANIAIAFFVNNKEGDGRDVSWIWDIDFEKLTPYVSPSTKFFVGGMRRNDLQVRMKYAGIESQLVNNAEDVLASIPANSKVYMIANYTSLPEVKASLDEIVKTRKTFDDNPIEDHVVTKIESKSADFLNKNCSLTLVQMYPSLLNLYGDNGNMRILEKRIRDRGIGVNHIIVEDPESFNSDEADIIFIGGGQDNEQKIAAELLQQNRNDLSRYVENNGVLLAICGGFQILGKKWVCGDDILPGLGLVDYSTKKDESNPKSRLTGDVLLQTKISPCAVVGYENHSGRTFFNTDLTPFGSIINNNGTGNNESDMVDGVLYKNYLGTYLHGPLLGKNPEIADYLIEKALQRKYAQDELSSWDLPALDDEVEIRARNYMYNRLGFSNQ